MQDFYTNAGYVIGPVMAVILADWLGNSQAFSVLGLIGVATALYLIKVTPKNKYFKANVVG